MGDASPVLDLRELPAPEPFERILQASHALAPGEELWARTPRFPRVLLPHLEARALEWEAEECADRTGLVRIRRPA